MMSITTLLELLQQHQVELWVEDDRLRYRAPKGSLTPQLRQALSDHKAELLATLKGTAERGNQTTPATSAPALHPLPRTAPLPLSFTQQRLWFIEQLQPGSPAYNILQALLLDGTLNIAALEQSINAIIQRHEILRTAIRPPPEHGDDAQPTQEVVPALRIHLTVRDLAHLPAGQREEATHQALNTEALRPFDLACPPLLRAVLLRHSKEQHVLLFATHHIAADGWSMQVLLRDLLASYAAFAATPQQSADLPPLPIQFADYAAWQHGQVAAHQFDSQLDYWRIQLAGCPALLALPTDYPRPALLSFRGGSVPVRLGQPLSAALTALSRSARVTLFMTLLAAFQVLLSRYTHQRDIVVATAVSHRPHHTLENLVGPCSNNVLLRSDLADNPDFQTLLQRVSGTVTEAFAHQDVPFEQLVEALQPQRSLSYNPLFQVLFLLQHTPSETQHTHGLTVAPYPLPPAGVSRFDLTLFLSETPQGLEGFIEYSSDLFAEATIARMASHLVVLLEAIIANPRQPVAALPLLTPAEQQRMLVEWNATHTHVPPACLHHLFEAQAARTPHAPALRSAGQHLSYAHLNTRANVVAHHLQAQGVQPGVLVGICIERSPALIIAILGVLKAGAAYLPLDPAYPPQRLAFLLADAQAALLLTREHLAARLPHEGASTPRMLDIARLLAVSETACASPSTANPISSATTDDLAYVIYTSGSTGTPKGVMVQHRSVCNLALAQIRAFQLHRESRVLSYAALSFDASVSEIFTTLLCGALLDLGEPGTSTVGRGLLHILHERAITTITLPPPVLATLPSAPLPHLETLVVAGEPCSAELVQRWAAGRHFINAYGPTETTVCATLALCDAHCCDDGTAPPIGRPIENTHIYLLDEHQQPVPIGVPGEISIGGVGVAAGYLHRPALTAERFIPYPASIAAVCNPAPGARLYRSGDLARYRADGAIEFLGRTDTQVKLRGFRVEPGEVEAALLQQPGVRAAVVVRREDTPGDARLVAYIVPAAGQAALPAHLRDALAQRLPAYMLPSAFVSLPALPLTAHGKVDRQALPPPAAPPPPPPAPPPPPPPPRDRLEQELLHIWEEVLGMRPLTTSDDFFRLGGHSLLAVRLLEAVRRRTGHDIPLTTLFLGGTVQAMARVIRGGSDALTWSPLVAMQPHGSRPPLFCVHPLLGVVFPYYPLAHHLGAAQPCYGLQAAGLHPGQQPHISIAEMAAHYLRAIRQVQPHGPYHLAGWSFGSLVAFEMAQQLHQQHEPVALLALLDTPAPGTQPSPGGLLLFLLTSLRFIWPYVYDYLALRSAAQRNRLPALVRGMLQRMPGARLLQQDEHAPLPARQHATVRRMVRLLALHVQVAAAYTPRVYPGRVVLLQTAATDAAAGWQRLAAGGVHVEVVPGNHYTMLRPPHVAVLAERLRGWL